MSGRSAYVRKEKTKVKDGYPVNVPDGGSEKAASILGEFPLPMSNGRPILESDPQVPSRHRNAPASSAISPDLAYARVRKPHVPVIDISGIEKSSFRAMVDRKSEGVRRGLFKTFGGKKKKSEDLAQRPVTSSSVHAGSQEADPSDFIANFDVSRYKQELLGDQSEYARPGPPQGKLPALPQGPQLKRWVGSGRAPQPWNKLRKDPELWDPNGDTLIYLGHETLQSTRPPPSFRISSHVLEATESRFLLTLLREGYTEESNAFNLLPSSVDSPRLRSSPSVGALQPTPPMSEKSMGLSDGQISYEIYFPAPLFQSRTETVRHQVTTRNVFAVLYQASLVGLNLSQALDDLQERLETYMPPGVDTVGLIIDYLVGKGIDDVRENPATAAALLAWSEKPAVRWEEGWKESFVHCVGMYDRLDAASDLRLVTPIARALLERASLEVQVRVQDCEDRLGDFDFRDMWPLMTSQLPPARASFEGLRMFFLQYYQSAYPSWPPAPPPGEQQWLTRSVARKLQKDFGALYNYLVNREVAWDCSEERSGRKWTIRSAVNKSFEADTPDLPFTDILVAFDNRHQYPHIPHPYPLVPESIPQNSSKENLSKASKKSSKQVDDRMTERRAALAYTESTNIYLLGSDYVNNDLVDAYMRFEKTDRTVEVDPFAARRGRWVLIYGILQTLAAVSVDTPNMRYSNEVPYYLNPRLRGTPPWKPANQNQDVNEASHLGSYCWTVRATWQIEAPPLPVGRRMLNQMSSWTPVPSVSGSETGSSVRSPLTPNSILSSGGMTVSSQARRARRLTKDSENTTFSNYTPGVEKLDEWPNLEERLFL